MNPSISIIDDNINFLTTLSINLRKKYQIVTFACPIRALNYLKKNPCDFYIIDIRMPKMNGMEFYAKLCKELHMKSLPAVFLTGGDDVEAKALNTTSISDYLKKPISSDILFARIKRILTQNNFKLDSKEIKLGNLTLIENKLQCLWFNNEIILTKREYNIVKTLIKHPRVVFTREQLLDSCYDHKNHNVTDRVIDSMIKRIRNKFRKIHPKNKRFDRIKTRYSLGYSWIPKSI